MRIDAKLLNSLNLENAAKADLPRWRDRFPPMIIERCLQSAGPAIIKYISTAYQAGIIVPSETLTMPKSGFGLRPVTVTDLPSRLLYSAVVNSLAVALPPPTRGPGKWDSFQDFGIEGSHEYVVELDVASFYEFIDHKTLKNELLLHSMNVDATVALEAYLQELMLNTRGIPQMLSASDRLADTYLGILDRRIAQDGFIMRRYVDDIKILANNWDDANTAIELASEYARDLGLILSSKKTGILKKTTLAERQSDEKKFYKDHFDQTQAAMTRTRLVGSYENVRAVRIKPEEKQAARAAAWKIISDWWANAKGRGPLAETPGPIQRFITRGLYVLRDHPDQLDPQLLADIVFFDGRKIEQVGGYLVARAQNFPEGVRDLRPLYLLIAMGRQSPWFKLWVLYAIEQMAPSSFTGQGALGDWILDQMEDRHEIVRAQAAWLCATRGLLQAEDLTNLYKKASLITQPALAAAAARQSNLPPSIVSAILADSALNREAGKWVTDPPAKT